MTTGDTFIKEKLCVAVEGTWSSYISLYLNLNYNVTIRYKVNYNMNAIREPSEM